MLHERAEAHENSGRAVLISSLHEQSLELLCLDGFHWNPCTGRHGFSLTFSRFLYGFNPSCSDSASARASAARTFLELALKGVELEDLAVRVEKLELQVSKV